MKIVLVSVSANVQLSGVSRHAANLTRCLLTRSEVSEVHLLVAPWEHKWLSEAVSRNDSRLHIHSVPIGTSTLARNLWFYQDLPAIASQLEADVVHLSYPSPLDGNAFHCPTVITLHDLYPYDIPDNFGFPKVLFNRLVLRQSLRAADAIACVSDSTLQQLCASFPQPIVGKTVRIYNCVEPVTPIPAQSPLPYWDGQPFLLCVAQHRRNKNILLVLKIFERILRKAEIDPAVLLVIVGVPGPETSQIHKFLRGAGLSQKVLLLSGIHEAEMQWCYRKCELLLAPSIVEGFGLPVAEAMLAGCRVVCSDIPAFRELGGDICRYVPLGSSAEEEFVNAVCTALNEARATPIALPQFSAAVVAAEYMRLYRALLLARAKSSHPNAFLAPNNHIEGPLL